MCENKTIQIIKSGRWYVSVLALVLVMFVSCDDKGDVRIEHRVQGNMTFLDVVGARSIILGGGVDGMNGPARVGGLNSISNSLFKITEGGVVQEIRYWQVDTIFVDTENGREVRLDSIEVTNTVHPVHIFNADANHLIVCFDKEEPDSPHGYVELEYLVRKSDGAVFQLPYGFRPMTRWNNYYQMFSNESHLELLQTDDEGNIYYVGKGEVLKIAPQNPNNVTIQQLTSIGEAGGYVSNYRVNGEGHIIYNMFMVTSPVPTRIRFRNGGLAYPEKNLRPFWLGFDNHFYFSYTPPYDMNQPSMPVVERITMHDNQVNYERIGYINHEQANLAHMTASLMFRLKGIEKIVVVGLSDHMNERGKVVAEVYNPEMDIKAFAMHELGISQINIAKYSDNYYYLSGLQSNQPVLLKVDASVFPHRAYHLVPPGAYDIYKMEVSTDDYLLINALRMSDGNIIIAEITPTGEVNQLEDIGSQIIQLVQIN
jgi:hypothetical protein